jgi:hypothetical protein
MLKLFAVFKNTLKLMKMKHCVVFNDLNVKINCDTFSEAPSTTNNIFKMRRSIKIFCIIMNGVLSSILLIVAMLSVTLLNDVGLDVALKNVIFISIIMLDVSMLSVVTPNEIILKARALLLSLPF